MHLAVLALLAVPVGAQQPPVFGGGVESVYVDAFVTRGGKAVTGLSASSFELRDEGRVRAVELVEAGSLPLTTLLVFDASRSVQGPKLVALRAAAGAFLDGLRKDDEAGVLVFSEEVRWLSRPTRDKDVARRAIAGLEPWGATAVWDAMGAALGVLPPASRSLVVVFSDGEDNVSWLDARQVEAQAARANAVVQVVGMWPEAGTGDEPPYIGDLRRAAEVTGGRFWRADSTERLSHAFRAIVEEMNSRYVLRFDPGAATEPGWHRLELRLRGARGDVRARQGYWRMR